MGVVYSAEINFNDDGTFGQHTVLRGAGTVISSAGRWSIGEKGLLMLDNLKVFSPNGWEATSTIWFIIESGKRQARSASKGASSMIPTPTRN